MTDLPLHNAVRQNDTQKVKDILTLADTSSNSNNHIIDINAEDDNGITALIEACISGNEEMVNILLKAGCPAQPPDGFKHTPLRGATVCGHHHLIPILLQHGADPNSLSDGNRTPLMGACFLRINVSADKSILCVKELLKDERVDVTVLNSFGESAMDLAKIREYHESISLLEKTLKKE